MIWLYYYENAYIVHCFHIKSYLPVSFSIVCGSICHNLLITDTDMYSMAFCRSVVVSVLHSCIAHSNMFIIANRGRDNDIIKHLMTYYLWCATHEKENPYAICGQRMSRISVPILAVWSGHSLFVNIYFCSHWFCKRSTMGQNSLH